MVECESLYVFVRSSLSFVLIDTWWNVNPDRHAILKGTGFVLIDTWWNVNVVE